MCTEYIDSKWAKTHARKLADVQSAEKRRAKDESDQDMLDRSIPSIQIDSEMNHLVSDDDIDDASITGYETGENIQLHSNLILEKHDDGVAIIVMNFNYWQ